VFYQVPWEAKVGPEPASNRTATPMTTTTVLPREEAASAVLEWRVWPAREQPARAAAAVGLALFVGLLALLVFHGIAAALVSSLVVVGAAGEFLFPTTYRLSTEGAEARNPFGWRKIAWKEVRRVYTGEREIKLSPLERPGRGEAYRGVLLRCRGNQEEVAAAVRRCRSTDDRDRESAEPGT
jgi:hypothetical protein